MKIIVPMAGKSERFSKENFYRPKPLIQICGKPLIEYVVNIFSREWEFIFICSKYHIQNTDIVKVLRSIVPNCKIIGIDGSSAETPGPVYTSTFAFDFVDDNEEVIVSYCDHDIQWDFQHFVRYVRTNDCDGAVPSFRGFHPALLGVTNYACIDVDENNYVKKIEEKKFSESKMKDNVATAVYYFKRGAFFKKYCRLVLDKNINVGGEAYMTLPFNLMIQDGLKILNYEVQKNIVLGTPRDYEQYKFWSEFFFLQSYGGYDNLMLPTTNIFPISGNERDFKEIGINKLNFMIPVMGKPLIHYTIKSYPVGLKNIFICLKENENETDESTLRECNPNTEILYLDKKTEGVALSILKAEKLVEKDSPVCVGGSTNIVTYDQRRLHHLFTDESVDVILFTFTHHENVLRNPNKYGYVKIENDRVSSIKEKGPISDNPYKDHALTGIVVYKKSSYLFDSIRKMISRPENKNFFFISAINELIQEGKKVVVFEVDHFVSLSTVIDYQEFLYWQDYFHNLKHHPYSKL